MDRILFIPVKGEIEDITHGDPDDINATLEVIKKKIGHEIDHFSGIWEGETGMFWCDDMGLLKDLPMNSRATASYCAYVIARDRVPESHIVGDVVACFGRYNQ